MGDPRHKVWSGSSVSVEWSVCIRGHDRIAGCARSTLLLPSVRSAGLTDIYIAGTEGRTEDRSQESEWRKEQAEATESLWAVRLNALPDINEIKVLGQPVQAETVRQTRAAIENEIAVIRMGIQVIQDNNLQILLQKASFKESVL